MKSSHEKMSHTSGEKLQSDASSEFTVASPRGGEDDTTENLEPSEGDLPDHLPSAHEHTTGEGDSQELTNQDTHDTSLETEHVAAPEEIKSGGAIPEEVPPEATSAIGVEGEATSDIAIKAEDSGMIEERPEVPSLIDVASSFVGVEVDGSSVALMGTTESNIIEGEQQDISFLEAVPEESTSTEAAHEDIMSRQDESVLRQGETIGGQNEMEVKPAKSSVQDVIPEETSAIEIQIEERTVTEVDAEQMSNTVAHSDESNLEQTEPE